VSDRETAKVIDCCQIDIVVLDEHRPLFRPWVGYVFDAETRLLEASVMFRDKPTAAQVWASTRRS
jgi:hypothetical protein